MKKPYLPALLLLLCLSVAWVQKNAPLPVGIWMNEEKEAQFEIYPCGNKLCGKITWLKEPLRQGKPKTDDKNPDARLQARPILGMVFMKDFVYAGNNKWDEGSIYDPKTGKTYSCYIKMINKDQMEVKGYIGISLIGRTQLWSRVK